MSILGFFVIGVAAGFTSGLLGVGGGVIAVPALVVFFGLSQQTAHGTSLAMIVPTAVVGAMTYWKSGHLDWRVAGVVALGAVSAAWLGATAAAHIDQVLLRRIFGVFIIVVGLQLLLRR